MNLPQRISELEDKNSNIDFYEVLRHTIVERLDRARKEVSTCLTEEEWCRDEIGRIKGEIATIQETEEAFAMMHSLYNDLEDFDVSITCDPLSGVELRCGDIQGRLAESQGFLTLKKTAPPVNVSMLEWCEIKHMNGVTGCAGFFLMIASQLGLSSSTFYGLFDRFRKLVKNGVIPRQNEPE